MTSSTPLSDSRILVIETATEACSVALYAGGQLCAAAHDVVGRGHAERLIPMIASLPDGGRAERILVGCGPGSFTGIRVGVSAARALGMAWDAQVRGYSTLALIAAQVFAEHPDLNDLGVAMHGGHGELFVQNYSCSPFAAGDVASLPVAEAARMLTSEYIVGNAAEKVVDVRGYCTVLKHEVSAHHAQKLPDAFLNLSPSPIYVRGADAQPMTEAKP